MFFACIAASNLNQNLSFQGTPGLDAPCPVGANGLPVPGCGSVRTYQEKPAYLQHANIVDSSEKQNRQSSKQSGSAAKQRPIASTTGPRRTVSL